MGLHYDQDSFVCGILYLLEGIVILVQQVYHFLLLLFDVHLCSNIYPWDLSFYKQFLLHLIFVIVHWYAHTCNV